MAIAIHKQHCFAAQDHCLKGKSKFWGFPDMPDGLAYPYLDGDPLTFICQINLEELQLQIGDTSCLPTRGMLYFFANIDYFLGWTDDLENGMGFWPKEAFRVLYAEDIARLNTHKSFFEDGTPAAPDAWSVAFAICEETDSGHKLLGSPFFDEVFEDLSARSKAPDTHPISLLQIDEDDDWGLRFFDSGMLNFIISTDALAKRDFSQVQFYFHAL